MELWIRSQDRQRLVKVNSLLISNFGEVYLENEEMILLGKYTPYERALEVLDEIEAILIYEKLERITGSAIIQVNNNVAIYEMPKE